MKWLRGDPLLMGAAIAYNSLFALVPLGVAFASAVKLLEFSDSATARVTDLINSVLPAEIAEFFVGILETSSGTVGAEQSFLLIISILVALWSGSRAVYAVQKSLRLSQAVHDDRGYLRARAVGIVVTVGAGLSVMIGYSVLLFGESLWMGVADSLRIGTIGLAQVFLGMLMTVWVFGLLWAVYRFGPPKPVQHTALVSLVVEVVLIAGSWFALTLLPSDARSTAAAFGVLGIVLVLLYFVGVTVVAGPIVVTAALDAWRESSDRYASSDDTEAIESEGSPQRGGAAREAPQ